MVDWPSMIGKLTLGRIFFGIATAASGIQQLITGNFVRLVPPLPAWVPWHHLWAYLTGIVLVVAGVAIGTGRRARWAATGLGAMLLLLLLLLVLPETLADPLTGFMWTKPCKVLALLAGAILLAGILPEGDAGRSSAIDRLLGKSMFLASVFLGGFLLVCGIQHFVYADFVMKLVPSWIPGPRLWTYFTGVALIAGGVGILLPTTRRLAATWSGVMVLLWVVLLHIPRALALRSAGETSAIFEALAISGVAFLLAGIYSGAVAGRNSAT